MLLNEVQRLQQELAELRDHGGDGEGPRQQSVVSSAARHVLHCRRARTAEEVLDELWKFLVGVHREVNLIAM
jgi:hypothetical protein